MTYLKKILEERHMTQSELAIRTGVTEASISRYCNGQRKISIDKAFDMAVALGIDFKEFVEGILNQNED